MDFEAYRAYRGRVSARLTKPVALPRTPVEFAARHGLSLDAKPRRRVAPVRPGAGLALEYRRKLLKLVDAMERSTTHWLSAAYRKTPPVLAQDESPARSLGAVVRALRRRWERRFTRMSGDLARYFAEAQAKRTDAALKSALKRGGFAVEFKMTRGMNDVLQAVVQENVRLIKSIPEQFFTQVEGDVMRSVAAGRDLHALTEALQHQHGVTRRRAELISRDQNNKATSSLARVRYQELGIRRARWLHSAGGKEPRPTHVRASQEGVIFDVDDGWYDPAVGKKILPGELINCRCTMVPILEDAA